MVFTNHQGLVANGPEDIAQGDVVFEIQKARAHADALGILPRHQGGPGGKTLRSIAKLVKAHTLGCKPIQVRCAHLAAVGANVREPHVIDHNQQNVGPIGGHVDLSV